MTFDPTPVDGMVDAPSDTDTVPRKELWPGDTGELPEQSRRALLVLVRGPYLSRARHKNLWPALLRDESAIRRRLNDLVLDLVVDTVSEVAFVRGVSSDEAELPKAVRSAPLTFLDTALLLILRQHLLDSDGSERVIVGRDDVFEQLEVYRDAATTDTGGFARRMNASWSNMKSFGIIADSSTEDARVEISPVLRLVFGPDEIAAVRAEFRRIASETPALGDPEPLENGTTTSDDGLFA